MKKYIKPQILCAELDADNLMIVMSNATEADAGLEVDVRRRRYIYCEDDFDEEEWYD